MTDLYWEEEVRLSVRQLKVGDIVLGKFEHRHSVEHYRAFIVTHIERIDESIIVHGGLDPYSFLSNHFLLIAKRGPTKYVNTA